MFSGCLSTDEPYAGRWRWMVCWVLDWDERAMSCIAIESRNERTQALGDRSTPGQRVGTGEAKDDCFVGSSPTLAPDCSDGM